LNQGRVTGERENALEGFFIVGKEFAAGVAAAVAASIATARCSAAVAAAFIARCALD
jgi:hypothetical protein